MSIATMPEFRQQIVRTVGKLEAVNRALIHLEAWEAAQGRPSGARPPVDRPPVGRPLLEGLWESLMGELVSLEEAWERRN